jgi:hypothetical protein
MHHSITMLEGPWLDRLYSVGLEDLAAVLVKSFIFCYITQCIPIEVNRSVGAFEGLKIKPSKERFCLLLVSLTHLTALE